MNREELRTRAIQELEFYKVDDTFMLATDVVDLAISALSAIEDIKAEIKEQAYLGINDEYSKGMFETLRIIDKHIEGDKE